MTKDDWARMPFRPVRRGHMLLRNRTPLPVPLVNAPWSSSSLRHPQPLRGTLTPALPPVTRLTRPSNAAPPLPPPSATYPSASMVPVSTAGDKRSAAAPAVPAPISAGSALASASSESLQPNVCQGPICLVSKTPGKPNQKCSRHHCKTCCQHVMRQSPSKEGRCYLNHHNLVRETPDLEDDARRRRQKGPAPPPSAVRPPGDERALSLKSHAGYVTMSWEKTLHNSTWERTPTDGLDARKERRALETSVEVYWWTEDDVEPVKMTIRTQGHGTFLPSSYATQIKRLMSTDDVPLEVFGAYDVRKGEWTQTEVAQKIPPQRVLFLRSARVRRTPGLESRVSAAFPSISRTPSAELVSTPRQNRDRDATPTANTDRGRQSMEPWSTSAVLSFKPALPITPVRKASMASVDHWAPSVPSSPTKRPQSPPSSGSSDRWPSPTKRPRSPPSSWSSDRWPSPTKRPRSPPSSWSSDRWPSPASSSPTKRTLTPPSPSSPTKRARFNTSVDGRSEDHTTTTPSLNRLAIRDLLCTPNSSPPPSPPSSPVPSASPSKPSTTSASCPASVLQILNPDFL
ncbi:hypothetical protein EV715DRAFT_295476 [Schizophyllum commune]